MGTCLASTTHAYELQTSNSTAWSSLQKLESGALLVQQPIWLGLTMWCKIFGYGCLREILAQSPGKVSIWSNRRIKSAMDGFDVCKQSTPGFEILSHWKIARGQTPNEFEYAMHICVTLFSLSQCKFGLTCTPLRLYALQNPLDFINAIRDSSLRHETTLARNLLSLTPTIETGAPRACAFIQFGWRFRGLNRSKKSLKSFKPLTNY